MRGHGANGNRVRQREARGPTAESVTGWSKSRRRKVPTGSIVTEAVSPAAMTASSDASTKPPFVAPTTREAWCKASAM